MSKYENQQSDVIWVYKLKHGFFEIEDLQKYLLGRKLTSKSKFGNILSGQCQFLQKIVLKSKIVDSFKFESNEIGSYDQEFNEFLDVLEKGINFSNTASFPLLRLIFYTKNTNLKFRFLKLIILQAFLLNFELIDKNVNLLKDLLLEWSNQKLDPLFKLFLENFYSIANFLHERIIFSDCAISGFFKDYCNPEIKSKSIEEIIILENFNNDENIHLIKFIRIIGVKTSFIRSVYQKNEAEISLLMSQINDLSQTPYFSMFILSLSKYYLLTYTQNKSFLTDLFKKHYQENASLFNLNEDEVMLKIMSIAENRKELKMTALKNGYLHFGNNPWINLSFAIECVNNFEVEEAFHYCKQIENSIESFQNNLTCENIPKTEHFFIESNNLGIKRLQLTDWFFEQHFSGLSNNYILTNNDFLLRFFEFYLKVCESSSKFQYCLVIITKMTSLNPNSDKKPDCLPISQEFKDLVFCVSGATNQKPKDENWSQVQMKSSLKSRRSLYFRSMCRISKKFQNYSKIYGK